LRRYRHLEAYPRLFARFKILLDPMFPRLADFVRPSWKIIDVGCGYAVPAAWLSAIYPNLRFLACDPREERARVAARVLGKSGRVCPCRALDLPLENEGADAVLLLDVLHYFSDSDLRELLGRIRSNLSAEGRLVIRVTIPGPGFRFFRFVEEFRLRLKGGECYLDTRSKSLGSSRRQISKWNSWSHRRRGERKPGLSPISAIKAHLLDQT
jgi:SAM-dependent methyltransferase